MNSTSTGSKKFNETTSENTPLIDMQKYCGFLFDKYIQTSIRGITDKVFSGIQIHFFESFFFKF